MLLFDGIRIDVAHQVLSYDSKNNLKQSKPLFLKQRIAQAIAAMVSQGGDMHARMC
ncbi:MAG: hypothetical protein ABFD81_13415 [Syntrophaceae bacterium]